MSACVGSDLGRPDGPAKVSGRAVYVADLAVAGAWHGGAVRSTIAHGRVLRIERKPGFDWRRVVVVGPGDVPGDNVQELLSDDQPILAERVVRHVGEPLLLVAAPDLPTLEAALAALRPIVEPLPAELDFESATRVLHEVSIDKGDPGARFDSPPPGARLFEGTWRTDSQEQLYVEPQGCVAWPADADGTVVVRGSMQCPHYVRKALARCFGIAPERARVVQLTTGGGFGGKEEYPSVVACHAALLARAAGRPVRIVYDRHEDLLVTPKRHPSRVHHRTLVAADGTLLAMDVDVLLDGGAYTTLSPVVLSRACLHASGPYRCEHVAIRGRVVATNHVPSGAFRGFGAPQTCFAIERQMDRIARALDLHPFALRRHNALRLGDATATGQVLHDSVGSLAVLDAVAARTGIDRHRWCAPAMAVPSSNSGRVRGLGMSFFFHGAGFTGSGEELLKGRVAIRLLPDGRAEVAAGSTEIGQGTTTVFTAIAADALGCDPGDVVVAVPDTAAVPDSGPTVASRTCMVVGSVLASACRELAARIGGAAGDFRSRARAWLAAGGDGIVEHVYGSPPGLVWDQATYRGDAYPCYGWAADVAEVEVDLDTLEVDVVRLTTAVDVGKAIQPRLVEGQITGGALQAIGWAQCEVVSSRDGRVQQDRLATCIVPTTKDAPRFDVTIVEQPYAHGPFGAKGVGELPMDGGAPAVLAAIEDALGVPADRVPATPERLLALLEQRERTS
ncbi:MAG: xanthine dehydrogenase family protein [Planctomycetes bacterium]|nr:xanthine dehydrogenase family protein [Planctomycetota bacterium]